MSPGGGDGEPGVGLMAKLDLLRRPQSYPEQPRQVEAVETHMSWVFLTDRHAYKMKKPVRTGFLDFATLEARRRDCRAEVVLNRRLAPHVYLGVLAITRERDGRLRLAGSGDPVEWLVWMKRLPRAGLLDQVIRDRRATAAGLRRIGRMLARFYEMAPRIVMAPEAYRQRLAAGVQGSLEALTARPRGVAAAQARQVAETLIDLLDRAPRLFDRRVDRGLIVEGHGDLRPEHISLEPEPAIIDCLEFNRDLRIVDPADELAYLTLECEAAGAPAVAAEIVGSYLEATGDELPSQLLDFHGASRALLRAKLCLWHLDDPAPREVERWLRRAAGYLDLAALHGDRLRA